jgi:hypothetical protein
LASRVQTEGAGDRFGGHLPDRSQTLILPTLRAGSVAVAKVSGALFASFKTSNSIIR